MDIETIIFQCSLLFLLAMGPGACHLIYFKHNLLFLYETCVCMRAHTYTRTVVAMPLCPWDFPGKTTEWVAMSSTRGSS